MRMRSPLLIVAAGALVIVIGSAVYLSSSGPNSSTAQLGKAPASSNSSTQQTTISGAHSGDRDADRPPNELAAKRRTDVPPPKDVEEFLTSLRTIMADTNGRRQRQGLLDLMEHLTPEMAPTVRETFYEMRKAGLTSELGWWAFCTRWGEIDPAGAFDFFAARPEDPARENVAGLIMEGWFAADPSAAREWLATQQDSQFFPSALKTYTEQLARSNLSQATRDAFALGGDGETLRHVLGELVKVANRRGQAAGVDQWFEGLSESEKSIAFEHAMWAIKDAELPVAAEWISRHADKPWRDDKHFHYVARRFAAEDPEAALSWALALPASPTRPDVPAGLSTIMETWTTKDPAAATAWLDQHRGEPWLPRAALGHVRVLMRSEPAQADAFLAGLPGPAREAVHQHLRGN